MVLLNVNTFPIIIMILIIIGYVIYKFASLSEDLTIAKREYEKEYKKRIKCEIKREREWEEFLIDRIENKPKNKTNNKVNELRKAIEKAKPKTVKDIIVEDYGF